MIKNFWLIVGLSVMCSNANVSLEDVHTYITIVQSYTGDAASKHSMAELHAHGVTAQSCLQTVAQSYLNASHEELSLSDRNQLFRYIGILESSLACNAAQDTGALIHAINRDPWTMFPIADTAANVLPHSTFKSSLGLGIFIWTIVSRHIHAMTDVENFTMEHAHEFIQNKQTQLIFRLGRKGADIYFGPDFMLAWAAWCGCIEFIEYFSDNGANIPLYGYYAIEAVLQEDGLYAYDRLQIVRRLLQHGARVSSTALQLARERNCDEINELLSLHYSIFADPEGHVARLKRFKKEFCSVM